MIWSTSCQIRSDCEFTVCLMMDYAAIQYAYHSQSETNPIFFLTPWTGPDLDFLSHPVPKNVTRYMFILVCPSQSELDRLKQCTTPLFYGCFFYANTYLDNLRV